MWVQKRGILLGTAMFAVVVALYLIVSVWRLISMFKTMAPPGKGEVGIDLVTLFHNIGFPLWLLLSFPVCLIIGCSIVAFWPSSRGGRM